MDYKSDESNESCSGFKEHLEFKTTIVDCPICNRKYRCRTNSFLESECGIINSILTFPICKHSFFISVDKNFKFRTLTQITKLTIDVQHIDIKYLKKTEKELLEIHKKAVRDRDDKAYEIFEEINKIRKEITAIEKKEKESIDDYFLDEKFWSL